MADYDEEYMGDLRKANAEVLASPDDFECWEKLLRTIDNLEGGLNRNSSPQSISAARDVYNRFLAKFPLFFGYWKKYADLEFSIAGTESAEYIYERGVASVGVSVDLWTHYCSFKTDTCHEPDIIRELFERGAESVGLDFLAHPFWDKYIEFEERQEAPERVFHILARIIHLPLHQYSRYYERYRTLLPSRAVQELVPEPVLQQITSECMTAAQMQPSHDQNLERDIRAKIDAYYYAIFLKTQAETNKRWTFEQEIKRLYFHVTELDEPQLTNWTKYLDFEEAEGDHRRIAFLYERCLVAAAHYDEYWQRYARYMYAQPGKVEETRCILARASYFYTPIARPAIRMQWALLEEANGRADVAADIYDAILVVMPDDMSAIIRLANLQLRQSGTEAAIAVYQQHLMSGENSSATKGSIVSEMAKLIYQTTGDADQARQTFERNSAFCVDSEPFWSGWLSFETSLPTTAKPLLHAKAVHAQMRSTAQLPPDSVRALSQMYMDFLTERGDKLAAIEYLDLDALVNGSAMTTALMAAKTAPAPKPVNGHDE